MPKTYLSSIKSLPPDLLPVPPPLPPPVSGEDENLSDLLYRIIRDSPEQQRNREKMTRHPFLDQAATQKAYEMARLNYFAHTSPSGVSANENVRRTGYLLPDWYKLNGNNVESLYVGSDPPDGVQGAAARWLASDHHRAHVYGQNPFFRDQNCIGIGHAPYLGEGEPNREYWVWLSAPCV